jgi:signal transduction histidine kinase
VAQHVVIDDETGPRESLRILFKNTYDVYCAESSGKGIELLKTFHPDVVILDIRMPTGSGIDGLREIRSLDASVSVVMLTGYASVETAQEAVRLGATDYVKKPFDIQEMRSVVERYIARTRMARSRHQTEETLRELNDKLREEIDKKDDMVSLGQASSAFIHDLKNPLTVICGYVELLTSQLEDSVLTPAQSKEVHHYLDIISRNALRCKEMSSTWRTAVKPDPSRMKPCIIADLVSEVEEGVQPLLIPSSSVFNIVHGPLDCAVLGDPVQLLRVLHNVVGNALQALPPNGGGQIDLRWTVEDDIVILRIQDNGSGISQEQLSQLFRVGYTTKAASGGMGLGLFVTRRVLEGHSGTIDIANRPKPATGVDVTIRLPLYRPST